MEGLVNANEDVRQMLEKIFIRRAGAYLFEEGLGHSPVYWDDFLIDKQCTYYQNEITRLLLRVEGQCPNVLINNKIIEKIKKSISVLKILIAVNDISTEKLRKATYRQNIHPRLWFTLNVNDPIARDLEKYLNITPDPKYRKKNLIYTWNSSMRLDDAEFIKGSSMRCIFNADCSRKITSFLIPSEFISLARATNNGLEVSVLNERYGRF